MSIGVFLIIPDVDNCSDDYLNSYKNQINLLNRIAKSRAVTTRANRKLQEDALKKALELNYVQDVDARNDNNIGFNSSSNHDFDATCDSSFADNNNNSSSSDSTKGLPGKKSLPDKYFCEAFPNKLMMKALRELNINDIKDFLMAGGPEKTVQFKKEKTCATSTVSLRVKSWRRQGSFNSLPTPIIF